MCALLFKGRIEYPNIKIRKITTDPEINA